MHAYTHKTLEGYMFHPAPNLANSGMPTLAGKWMPKCLNYNN